MATFIFNDELNGGSDGRAHCTPDGPLVVEVTAGHALPLAVPALAHCRWWPSSYVDAHHR